MRDGGDHGNSGRRAHAADVGEEDVADDEDFGEKNGIIWAWISPGFLSARERCGLTRPCLWVEEGGCGLSMKAVHGGP